MPRLRVFRRVSEHPDLLACGAVLAVGVLVRALVLHQAPVFITKDSVSFFLPGWDLAHDRGFDLQFRRTPGYPILIALSLKFVGDSLQAVALVQHALGIGTALVSYWAGAMAFGRRIAVIGGLLAAVSGPLLMYEHSVMPETLTTALLVLATALLLRGVLARWYWLVSGGLVLGLAVLTRPAVQLVALVVPIVLLVAGAGFRRSTLALCSTLIGLGIVVLPWMSRVYAEDGVFSLGATIGEPMVSRTVHGERWLRSAYDQTPELPLTGDWLAMLLMGDGADGFALPDQALNPYPDDDRNGARRAAIKLSARRENPSDTAAELVRSFDLTRPGADAILRDLASEQIRAQPGYFITSTAEMSAILLLGRHEGLDIGWTKRRDRAGEEMQDNWYEVSRIRQLVKPTTEEQRAAYPMVNSVIELFQPYRFNTLIVPLLMVGMLATLGRHEWRPALVLSLAIPLVLGTSTMFSWASPRYRYPVDPLIYTVTVAGAAVC
ncbi:MAG: glycosyltransferase family 39 protein, partial [Chloroflexi bacterium]|nr:glycosyltransferase family 39 protein [Chloroflexota bacterium]